MKGLALVAVAVLGTVGIADAAKKDKPNLKVVAIGKLPAATTEGSTFQVKAETTANAGKAKASATATRFYLTRDAKASIAERKASKTNPRSALTDVLLEGVRAVPALDAGERSKTPKKKPTKLRVPLGTTPGTYQLLACADDRGGIRESNEADNCLAAGEIKVAQLAGDFRIDEFSDFAVETDEQATENLETFKPILCAPTNAKGGSLGLNKALARVDKLLVSKVGGADVKAFEKSADYKSSKKLEAAAANALIAKTPGAALAALVRMHELEPKEASHLVNAASVATAVGLPREALAMLDAADRLDDNIPSAWGLNRDAVALTNRGQALASLGRFAEAEKVLVAARALDPTLKEASETAATAALCQNKMPAALFHRKKGKHRKDPPPRPDDDDSLGIATGLRELHLPGFPKQGPDMYTYYVDQSNRSFQEITGRQQRQRAFEDRWEAKNLTRAERKKGNNLLLAAYRAGESPRIDALERTFFQQVDEVHAIHEAFWCGDNACSEATTEVTIYRNDAFEICEASEEDWDTCYAREFGDRCRPATRSRHQEWLDAIQEAYDAGNAHQRALSKRISAIAAHAKDPDLHQLILIAIEEMESASFFLVQQPAHFWTNSLRIEKQHCVDAPEPPAVTAPAPVAGQSPGACPDALKSTNALLDIGPVQLKVSCEQVQLAGNLGEGWIKGFGELTYDFRAGKISVFAGSQGEVAAGPLKADFKSGLYVTVNNQGIEDAGWRVGPSVTVGGGPAEFNPSDMVDISFVGVFSGP